VYADKDNKPATYSKDNVPYQPKHFAEVSTQGIKEGDYAMTIGFPGSTSRYIPSWGVQNRMDNENSARIEVRGAKQAIWRKFMDADQATRI
ncbi:S46 family peptidase, partial [Salmonella enterica subsp. enterica serovar Typhimurium]|uniref:S46 family peptidase n=1 Tax=Salmonella enterica TaxID=28901 RepID=UPI0020A2F7D7